MVRLCSICRNEGHDRRTCPLRTINSGMIIDEPVIRRNNPSICGSLTNTIINMFNYVLTGFTTIIVILGTYDRNRTSANVTQYTSRNHIPRNPIPKCISNIIYESEDILTCSICLSDIIKETFKISSCGHYYCDTCYNDSRLDKCAICRNTQF